jgi:P4 family phage/plasmid primase-like protien
MEASLKSYLTFLGRKDDEPIYLQVISPRQVLRSAATAVATSVDEAVTLLRQADQYQSQGDYIVANRVNRGVVDRYRTGAWVPDQRGEGISDSHIVARRCVYIDCDCVRDAGDGPVSGISATAVEMLESLRTAGLIRRHLVALLGGSSSLGIGGSGNGGHVHIALDDLDPTESLAPVKELLAVLAAKYDTDRVHIDCSVVDAKRIAPAFGTVKRKGANSKERPWRRTWFIAEGEGSKIYRLSLAELDQLVVRLKADLSNEQTASLAARNKPKTGGYATESKSPHSTPGVDGFGSANRLPYAEVMTRLGIALQCPGCGETKDSGLYEPGNRWHCFRASCQPSSPKGSGNWGVVDAIARARGVEAKVAMREVCEAFGIELPRAGRPRKTLSLEEVRARVCAEPVGIIMDGNEPEDDNDSTELWLPPSGWVKASNETSETNKEPELGPESTIEFEAIDCKIRRLDDIGNAERLVDRCGTDLRFVPAWGQWIVWDGSKWSPDQAGTITLRAIDTVRSIEAEALHAPNDTDRARIVDWASRSAAKPKIDAMVALAKGMLAVTPAELDQAPLRLNCSNGTVNLVTGALAPHRREDLLTVMAGADYVPHDPKEAPLWTRFLSRVQPDPEVRKFLQRLMGASILGEVREHILPVHIGTGRNGKGVFFETLISVLGSYATTVPQDLLVERGQEHPTLLATLYGRRLAIASETERGDVLPAARIKALCGGDTISCRRMREDYWTFAPTHQLQLQTNHLPRVTDTGAAVWARLLLINWGVTIPDHEQDKSLKTKLWAERCQIMGWIVEGAMAYLRHGLDTPASVTAAVEQWRGEEDLIGQFLAECCVSWEEHGRLRKAGGKPAEPEWYRTSKSSLYTAYSTWCEGSGCRALSAANLRRELVSRGYTEARVGHESQRVWLTLGLSFAVDARCADIEADLALTQFT